ncbi:unnamed protein product [Clavelina lepadiformis]|uniref:cholesterol 7-desaturase n=1 Tax=Clavelina lepadiformis TaxID=159417 RepID=A0ABP0GWE5_CLALP
MSGALELSKMLLNTVAQPAYDVYNGMVTIVSARGNQTTSGANDTSKLVTLELTTEDIQFYMTLKLIWAFAICFVGLGTAFTVLYYMYVLFFVPYERVKRLGSIGYLNHEAGQPSKKEIANLIRKRRKIGEDLPPVYPNGWFRLVDSLQLKKGEVKEVSAIGQHFAVFRTQTGKAHILDAYCPHMGGNLGVGGQVKGECLECPFHGWVFSGKGECVKIPYSEKVPSFAKTKSWPSREVNGAVFVWYHCDGVEPEWELPVVEDIANGNCNYLGRVEHHVNTHIQDLPENGSDQAHLSHLHVPNALSGNDLSTQFSSSWNFAQHIFKAYSKGSDEDTPHISKFDLTHYLLIFNRWRFLQMFFKVYQIGPGCVHLHFTSLLWKGVFVQTVTPLEPLHQVITHNLYGGWTVPLWLGRIFLFLEAVQVDRDVMIWNNKTFRPRPKLVKEDNLIAKYRRWFAQFYTENSPRLQMKTEDDASW